MDITRTCSALMFALTLSLGVTACNSHEGSAERVGEKIDDAADDVKDAARDAKEEIKDAADDVKKEVND